MRHDQHYNNNLYLYGGYDNLKAASVNARCPVFMSPRGGSGRTSSDARQLPSQSSKNSTVE
jgi:hypothetical protein